jgi:invasion protein IalB
MGHGAVMKAFLLTPLLVLSLTGCYTVAKTAVQVATLPVQVVAAGVDAATTSQSEADQKRGRELRKAEEAAGKRQCDWDKACEKAEKRGEPCPPRPSL